MLDTPCPTIPWNPGVSAWMTDTELGMIVWTEMSVSTHQRAADHGAEVVVLARPSGPGAPLQLNLPGQMH
ncbi:MAG: hypothetical protein M3N45_14340 [Actinomycetota bacterium]|nr:hypothetical protein [Actinomycetota bacterium]